MTAASNPLGGSLLLVGIVIVLASPRKLNTLGRMAAVFLALAGSLLVVGALLRRDPEMFAALTLDVAIGAADAVGVLYIRSLRRRPVRRG